MHVARRLASLRSAVRLLSFAPACKTCSPGPCETQVLDLDKLSWRRPTYSATLGMDPHPTHMPRPGDPGVVGAPLSWEEACTYIKEEQYEKLGRMPESLLAYRVFRNEIKRKFVSVEDHIATLAFGLPTEMDPAEGGKLRAVWPIAGAVDGGRVRLVWLDNDFPYALQAGIQHLVLWSTGALDEATLRAAIAARYDAARWECAWFVNPPALKSVKRIEHAHVLCRLKAP